MCPIGEDASRLLYNCSCSEEPNLAGDDVVLFVEGIVFTSKALAVADTEEAVDGAGETGAVETGDDTEGFLELTRDVKLTLATGIEVSLGGSISPSSKSSQSSHVDIFSHLSVFSQGGRGVEIHLSLNLC